MSDLPQPPAASPGKVQPSWTRIVGLGAAARVISLLNDIPLVVATQLGFKDERKEFGKALGLVVAGVTGAVASMIAFVSYYDGYDRFKDTGAFKSAEKMISGAADFFNRRFTDHNITAEAAELADKTKDIIRP